jgi:cyclopropane fatty-acyl-phospholipid synthase-like methyltransferase
MANHWEPGRAVLWETTRPVSEWLVDRLAPQPGQTILELAVGAGETGFLAAARLGESRPADL